MNRNETPLRLAALITRVTRHALAIAISLTWATSAHATAFMEIVWTQTTSTNPLALASLGTNVILADPGDFVTAELRVVTDSLGLNNVFLSVAYDEDLKDELNFVGASHVPSTSDPNNPFSSSLSAIIAPVATDESDSMGRGIVTHWDSTTGPVPSADGLFGDLTIVLGWIQFQVTSNVVADGPDVRLGKVLMFDELTDSYGNPLSEEIAGSVNLLTVPEPSTALLMALGLVLLGARRRTSN